MSESFPYLTKLFQLDINLQTVGENSISGCTQLRFFRIWLNAVTSLPENLFVNTPDITYIDIDNNQLTTLPENLFAPLLNLSTLEIRNNPYQNIPGGIFRNQANLRTLIMDGCRISNENFNSQWFAPLENLLTLYLGNNLFTSANPELFANLPQLMELEFSGNQQIQEIQGDAFSLLPNLFALSLSNNRIREINPDWFGPNIEEIFLNFNLIEELPEGIFEGISNLYFIGLWRNQLKTIPRNAFGNLNRLGYMDLDENVINALDRQVFEDSANSLFVLVSKRTFYNAGLCSIFNMIILHFTSFFLSTSLTTFALLDISLTLSAIDNKTCRDLSDVSGTLTLLLVSSSSLHHFIY